MSVRQMSLVWDRADVDQGTLLVLLALADWANDQGVCWPSIPRVALKSRLGERQVRRIIADLEERKIIEIQHQRGRGKTNVYKLNLTICPVLIEIKAVTDDQLEDEKQDIGDMENRTSTTEKQDIGDSTIRKEPSRTTIEPPGEEAPTDLPEDFPAISFAQKIVEELCLGTEPGILHTVAGAVSFVVKFDGKTKNAATEYLIALARDELESGGTPTRFWFSDRKWRNGNGSTRQNHRQEASRAEIESATTRLRERITESDQIETPPAITRRDPG